MLGEALRSRAWRYVEPARNWSVDERANGDAVRMVFVGSGRLGCRSREAGAAVRRIQAARERRVGGAWAAGAVERRVACSRRDGAHHGRREHGRDGAAPTRSTIGPESREMRRPDRGRNKWTVPRGTAISVFAVTLSFTDDV